MSPHRQAHTYAPGILVKDDGVLRGRITTIDFAANISAAKTGATATVTLGGAVHTLSTNYVSGTGTAGVDNTAQAVKTIVLTENTLFENGDRIRIRSYWKGDTGAGVTATMTVNGITIAATTDAGAATFQVNEAWLHYLDSTHANIISMSGGTIDTTISNNNVAGFNWAADQNISVSQNQIANNHIVVYFLSADIFHRT